MRLGVEVQLEMSQCVEADIAEVAADGVAGQVLADDVFLIGDVFGQLLQVVGDGRAGVADELRQGLRLAGRGQQLGDVVFDVRQGRQVHAADGVVDP